MTFLLSFHFGDIFNVLAPIKKFVGVRYFFHFNLSSSKIIFSTQYFEKELMDFRQILHKHCFDGFPGWDFNMKFLLYVYVMTLH